MQKWISHVLKTQENTVLSYVWCWLTLLLSYHHWNHSLA